MAIKLKEIAYQEDKIAPGHRACHGCPETIIVRQVLHAITALGKPVVTASATGCLEVCTSPFPHTAWRVPWIHNAFENVSSTLAAAWTTYRHFVKLGKMTDRDIKFVAFAGDGATYDIGLQWLSGVVERGQQILYVCLNNEAYMNTGIQRSAATPLGAWTTTSPVGRVIPGKTEHRKDMVGMMVANGVAYAAQAAPHAWRDLMTKVQKAVSIEGTSYIDVISPCPRGWRFPMDETIRLSRLAVETCMWPLFEVEYGKYRITSRPTEKKPVIEYLKAQRRFEHLFVPGNKHVIDELQRKVDEDWERLQKLAEMD
ncbi:Pyruvate synthase subunit PorB [subsurface metagenome]